MLYKQEVILQYKFADVQHRLDSDRSPRIIQICRQSVCCKANNQRRVHPKCLISDVGHRSGNDHVFQRRACVKRIVIYFVKHRRQHDLGQVGTCFERVVLDLGDLQSTAHVYLLNIAVRKRVIPYAFCRDDDFSANITVSKGISANLLDLFSGPSLCSNALTAIERECTDFLCHQGHIQVIHLGKFIKGIIADRGQPIVQCHLLDILAVIVPRHCGVTRPVNQLTCADNAQRVCSVRGACIPQRVKRCRNTISLLSCDVPLLGNNVRLFTGRTGIRAVPRVTVCPYDILLGGAVTACAAVKRITVLGTSRSNHLFLYGVGVSQRGQDVDVFGRVTSLTAHMRIALVTTGRSKYL